MVYLFVIHGISGRFPASSRHNLQTFGFYGFFSLECKVREIVEEHTDRNSCNVLNALTFFLHYFNVHPTAKDNEQGERYELAYKCHGFTVKTENGLRGVKSSKFSVSLRLF